MRQQKIRENRLVWAVTGAGKTEMLFAVLHQTLQEGGRIALASPRVDVCLELFPRIQAVFLMKQLLYFMETVKNRIVIRN